MNIVVLCGGVSAEREVSLQSGERVARALAARGHRVRREDLRCEEIPGELLGELRAAACVFLALHGGAGEDGRVQRQLEREGILHYTGSGPAASALAMQKQAAKACVARVGVPVAEGFVLWPGEKISRPTPLPLAVKPLSGGSSVGLRILREPAELAALSAAEPLLCERFLPGREYSVSVLQSKALPPVEIRPLGGIYDYAHKYTKGYTEELCPAPIAAAELERLQMLAERCFTALGLGDYGRIDFREDEAGVPHFLEANTLPGMTETSLLPLSARAAGISFPRLCEEIARMAEKRGNS